MDQVRVDNHDILANKGIEIYSNWLKRKEQQDDNYRYQLFAAVDKYSPFDLLQMKINVEDSTIEEQQYIELKVREININEYEDCSIETYKMQKLQTIAKLSEQRVFLVAIYEKDRKIAIWEIDADKEYDVRETTAKWHTAENWGKKVKQMARLYLKDAHIYSY